MMTLTDAESALRWATPCDPRDWELNEYAWVGESLTNRPEVEKKMSTIMEKIVAQNSDIPIDEMVPLLQGYYCSTNHTSKWTNSDLL